MNLRIWPAIGALLVLASCTQGTEGIFASIEREQKVQSSGGLSNEATVSHMAELNGNYYIAGGGTLFHRTTSETKWHSETIISGSKTYDHFLAVGLVTSISTLYAVANQDASDTNVLFESTDGSTWTAVTLPTGTGTKAVRAAGLVPIRHTDGYSSDELLLTVTETDGTYKGTYDVVYILGAAGTSASLSTAIAVPSTGTATNNGYLVPVKGAAVTNTDYYFINNDGLFHYDGSSTVRVTDTTDYLAGNGFSDVLLLAPGTLTSVGDGSSEIQALIGTSKGTLYWGTISGDTWTYVGRKKSLDDSVSETVSLGQMILQNENSTSYVWIGTGNAVTYAGAGFVSLATDDLSVALQPPKGTDKDNYNSTDLPTTEVLMFFRASDGTYFLGTGAYGLWKWNSSTKKWSQQ